MPTRFNVAGPRSYAGANGEDRTGYTRSKIAHTPEGFWQCINRTLMPDPRILRCLVPIGQARKVGRYARRQFEAHSFRLIRQ